MRKGSILEQVISLATLHLPDLNPVGLSSLMALFLAALAWVLVDLRKLSPYRHLFISKFLVVIAVMLFFSDAPILFFMPFQFFRPVRFYPNVDDYIGNYILMSIAVLLSWRAFQLNRNVGVYPLVIFSMMCMTEIYCLVFLYYLD